MKTRIQPTNQAGLVSIFTVLFFSMLMSVITVGFARIMFYEQGQSIDNSLSQNAYDAAQSGVEDGKRALTKMKKACSSGATSLCDQYKLAINSEKCQELWTNSAVRADMNFRTEGAAGALTAVLAGENASSNSQLQLRYTCLTIKMNTLAYKGTLEEDNSILIPLDGVTNNVASVLVKWHDAKDPGTGLADLNPNGFAPIALPNRNVWNNAADQYAPPIMRAQVLEVPTGSGTTFSLSGPGSLDDMTRSLFLYPVREDLAGAVDSVSITADARPQSITETSTNLEAYYRRTMPTSPRPIRTKCNAAAVFSCQMKIVLDGSMAVAGTNKIPYLRLSSIYKTTNFEVQLLDELNTPIAFEGVQPEIDVTARANNIYRRVKASVGFATTTPSYGLEIEKSLCKDMLVTTIAEDYVDDCTGFGVLSEECSETPHDIILVLDSSHSMTALWNSATRTRLMKLQESSAYLLRKSSIGNTTNHASVIQFNATATNLQPLTGNVENLTAALQRIQVVTGTMYGVGLDAAKQEFTNSRSGARKAIVFISDGLPGDNKTTIQTKANELKASGVALYTIAIAEDVAGARLILESMSGNGGVHHDAPTTTALDDVVNRINFSDLCN